MARFMPWPHTKAVQGDPSRTLRACFVLYPFQLSADRPVTYAVLPTRAENSNLMSEKVT
jgi:hypothetical protein